MRKVLVIILGAFCLTHSPLMSSDLIEVLPLTDRIIMLHFRDGKVVYHKKGQERTDDFVISEPLNEEEASEVHNYQISSLDDTSYPEPVSPDFAFRKSKGFHFTWLCEGWSNETGCVNDSPDHVKEHWVYLQLPTAMQTGKTYHINTGSLAKNSNDWSMTFDEKQLRSEAVHVNLMGYSTLATAKYGYVYHWMGDGKNLRLNDYADNDFYIIERSSGDVRYTGKLKFRKLASNPETGQMNDTPNGNFLGAEVYDCDFSSFNEPGEYQLVVKGFGSSFPFRIHRDVYRQAYYTAIRGLYHNRSGIELTKPFTEYERPAPHNPSITQGFDTLLKYTESRFIDWEDQDHSDNDKPAIEAGIKGSLNTWGWYQDAGDWDGYFSHLQIPSVLMFTYETVPINFADGELNIPGSGNGIPDILDEAGWLMRFFYRTRHELMDKDFGTGGIGSRITPDHFGGHADGIGSYEDNKRTWIVSGEDPHTTFQYAALAAQMAYILEAHGMTVLDTIHWANEARDAYVWALANTKPGDENPGSTHGIDLREIRAYASASLYRLTGQNEYLNAFKSDITEIGTHTQLSGEQRWGPYIYAFLPENLNTDAQLMSTIRGAVKTTADYHMAENIDKRACRWGGDWYFPMLVGQGTTPWIIEGMMGYAITRETDTGAAATYLRNMFTTCDYLLGNNPLNMTWVTQLGERYPDRLLHIDAWYNGKDEMHPGLIPYGPWRDSQSTGPSGPWDLRWPYQTLYPASIDLWPGHERWFNNYTTPLNAEFTVHQNTVFAAAAFGFLCGAVDGTYVPNRKPGVAITSPSSGTIIDSAPVSIIVDASDPDGYETIERVEFYNDWHLLGTSYDEPFTFSWETPTSGNIQMRARVYDKEGLRAYSEIVNMSSSLVTGIPDNAALNDIWIRVYPNPGHHYIKFDLHLPDNAQVDIQLLDLMGRQVLVEPTRVFTGGDASFEVNVPEKLATGTYIYRVQLKEGKHQRVLSGKIVLNPEKVPGN